VATTVVPPTDQAAPQAGRGVEDVLAVVEDHEGSAALEEERDLRRARPCRPAGGRRSCPPPRSGPARRLPPRPGHRTTPRRRTALPARPPFRPPGGSCRCHLGRLALK
jgi:hypothetical protein